MSQDIRGWRALPAAMVITIAAWFVFTVFRLGWVWMASEERMWSARVALASEGVTSAGFVLLLAGAIELARRTTGRVSLGIKIAGIGFALSIVMDLVGAAVSFDFNMWDREWLRYVFDYGWYVVSLLPTIGFTIALWDERRGVALGLLVVALATNLPPIVDQQIDKALALEIKARFTYDLVLRLVRLAVTAAYLVLIARGVSLADRTGAALGLRTVSRGMWLRVIAAISVALITIVVIGGRGSKGAFDTLKLAMMIGAIVNIVALAMFGVGALRSARATIPGLPRVHLALAATGSLWCAGVALGQLGFLYRSLYEGGDAWGLGFDAEYVQAFSVVVPLVVIASAILVILAIASLAKERNSIELGTQVQSKGVGFVVMMLVSLAIQFWMLPKATSPGSLKMLMLLAGVAGLIGTVMIAKLCALAADELDREPGLPQATVVSDPS